ncbi:MAG TPA: DUF1289 domain-containing protein [Xanthobacteraceae bacterium]|nr:DUF1289 domain-containing protein [Xanthobacteraceae bacterium]
MGTIETPCIKVCVIAPRAGACLGCGRSLAEIAHWLEFTPEQRRRIMGELPQRLSRHVPQTA